MKFKKLLLSLGTVAAVAAPVAAVVACGVDESKVNYVFDTKDKNVKAAIDKDGVLKSGTSLKTNTLALDGTSPLEERFVAFEVTETTAKAADGTSKVTQAFSKGSAVQLVKTVVQYLKDMNVKYASTFSIEIQFAKVTTTTAADKKVTTTKPTYGRAKLDIVLPKTETKNITEKLVNIKASNGSTPKPLIKADQFKEI